MKRVCDFFRKYSHIWLLSYFFIYIPWFCYLEKTVTRDYHLMHAPLDSLIPFNEYFIIPYLLWFAFVGVALIYFLIKSKEDYYRMCTFLFSGMTISLIICTFFENGTNLRPILDPDKNIFTAAVAALYRTDTCTNVFPSIHVYNSIGTYIAIHKSPLFQGKTALKAGAAILTAAICLSTVFLKQHSVIDGVGAGIMAAMMYHLVYACSPVEEEKKIVEKILE